MKPERDNAPPKMAAIKIRGRRMRQIISIWVLLPSLLKMTFAISPADRCTLPVLMFKIVIKTNAAAKITKTIVQRRRRLASSL